VAIAASLIIVDRLRRLFLKFTSDAPFDADNARHLRVIWITMAAAELSRYVIMAIIAGLLLNFGRPEGVSVAIEPDINLSTWAAILILVVLAEVFAQGARMREEQDLTI
jgi:preprotein translocase subunit Sec61beta